MSQPCNLTTEMACAQARGWPREPRMLFGHGNPNGEEVGYWPNDQYLDEETGLLYVFNGTPGTKYGWAAVSEAINVQALGARVDGVTDDTTSINNALTEASTNGSEVFFPPGTYKINGQLLPFNKVSMIGSGVGSTILDFSDTTATIACILAQGSLTDLPALNANISMGGTTVTFASAHGLAVGDEFIIYDSTDYSFSLERPYYRAGEFVRVANVINANEVKLATGTYAAYATGAARKLFKINPVQIGIRGFTMRFKQGVTVSGIKITLGTNLELHDLDLTGSKHAQIYLDRCYTVNLQRIRAVDYQAAGSNNYGIIAGNSQDIIGSHMFLEATRHGWATGGGDFDGAVPNRGINISLSRVSSSGESHGFDCHGNCEWIQVSDCDMPAGFVAGGDHIRVSDSYLSNQNLSGYAIATGKTLGMDYEFIDNVIEARESISNGIISLGSTTETTRSGGTMVFRGNKVMLGSFGDPTYPVADTLGLKFGSFFAPPTDDYGFIIEDNEFSTDVTTTGAGNIFLIRQQGVVGGGFRRLTIRNNTLNGGAIRTYQDVQFAFVEDNKIYHPVKNALYMATLGHASNYTAQEWHFVKNYCPDANQTGVQLFGNSFSTLFFDKNTITNSARVPTGGGVTDANLRIDTFGTVHLTDNKVGDSSGTPSQLRTYSVLNVTNLYRSGNINIGRRINSITHFISGVTNEYPLDVLNNQFYGSAAPVAGTFRLGDIVWNNAPTAGGTVGWICTTAGTPGTWKTFGSIAP